MTALDNSWFSEKWEGQGSAIALHVERKLHDERSAYQRIEVYETAAFGTLMTLDGLVMVTDRDNFIYHEMMAHTALFTHANPKHVLIIGGGDCGTLHEVLKHPGVEQVVQVELDERVTRVAEKFFPELCASNKDARAQFHFADGIRWMADAPAHSVDVIIVDGTDPIGPAAGLFSEAFYKNCLRVLRGGGVLIGQSESPLFHAPLITAMHRALRGAGFQDARTVHFPQCTYPSGWWSATLAGKERTASNFRAEAAAHKTFATRYYNGDIHRGALALPEFLQAQLKSI
ncbi:MAG: polyamine aminopropyltransferase [Pseudomonadota bacterium]